MQGERAGEKRGLRGRRGEVFSVRLPLETVRKFAYASGAVQVEGAAAELVREIAEQVVRRVWSAAVEIARSNRRKRVLRRDVEVAVNLTRLRFYLD